jgi:hypothetical protein
MPVRPARQRYATSSAILPRKPARRRSIAGISRTAGSPPTNACGALAHVDHASSDSTPGAHAAKAATENLTSFIRIVHSEIQRTDQIVGIEQTLQKNNEMSVTKQREL